VVLVDTDIMVDILRNYPPAVRWLEGLGDEEIALPGFVVMELSGGEPDRQSLDRTRRILDPYRVYWPTADDCDRALTRFGEAHLSHGLSAFDALIAETAKGLRVPLHTFNTRHYRALPDLETVQPYPRSDSG